MCAKFRIPVLFSIHSQAASSSSDTSAAHARVDSIDSGNDGDESGLESSLSCNNKLMETRKKLDVRLFKILLISLS